MDRSLVDAIGERQTRRPKECAAPMESSLLLTEAYKQATANAGIIIEQDA